MFRLEPCYDIVKYGAILLVMEMRHWSQVKGRCSYGSEQRTKHRDTRLTADAFGDDPIQGAGGVLVLVRGSCISNQLGSPTLDFHVGSLPDDETPPTGTYTSHQHPTSLIRSQGEHHGVYRRSHPAAQRVPTTRDRRFHVPDHR